MTEQKTEQKHTPGPWVYARDFDEQGRRAKVTTVAVCCEFVIGLPAAYEGGNYRDGDPSGSPEADACLIAAAPELLEALVDVMFRHVPFSNKSDYAERARAAIAKATGQEAA